MRHFLHLRVRHTGGDAVLPLILTLNADDAAELDAALPAVIADLLFILRLHAASILPGGGGAAAVAVGQPAASALATAIYHGHLVSASFEVREPEACYVVLEMPAAADAPQLDTEMELPVVAGGSSSSSSGGGGGGVSRPSAAASEWTALPLTAFRLFASVRHKANERRRRKERLLASPSKIDAYLQSSGTSGKR